MAEEYVDEQNINGIDYELRDYGRNKPNGVPTLDENGKIRPGFIPASVVYDETPVGSICAFAMNSVPDSFLICDGRWVLISDYPELFAKIGGLYGSDYAAGKFRMPDLSDKFLEGEGSHTTGSTVEAGLPNIVGVITTGDYSIGGNSRVNNYGALKGESFNTYSSSGTSQSPVYMSRISFNAQNGETKTDGSYKTSSDYKVYGKSDTVQPPAVVVTYAIKAKPTVANKILDLVYPVGSLYMSANNISPTALFGGVWTQIKDRFILGAGDSHEAGETGGEETHTLTVSEMPSHSHTQNIEVTGEPDWEEGVTSYMQAEGNVAPDAKNRAIMTTNYHTELSGEGEAHNNMPPYITVYIWQRIS